MTDPDPGEGARDALFHQVIRHFLDTPPPRSEAGRRAPAEPPPRSPRDGS